MGMEVQVGRALVLWICNTDACLMETLNSYGV